ncbi:MAG TPA: 2-dehydro-3-deoxyphosphooctonate aldolase [Flavobacterium sp.]
MKKLLVFVLLLTLASCVSTKSTIKNIDDNAPTPKVTKDNTFVITEYSTDPRYGYDPDYPINIFFKNTKDDAINQQRFLNALAGPKGEKVFFKRLESCCPFPTKRSEMGAGFLDVYEITWVGLSRPIRLYMNIYEKGRLMVPMGFALRKTEAQP